MVCISIVIGATALHYLKKNVLQRIEGNLDIALQQVDFLFRDWVTLNERNLQTITKDDKFVTLVQQQLSAYKAGELEEQGALTGLREFFLRHEDRWGKSGFFVIAPDCINIASMRDSNIGVRNLIVDHRPELIYSALNGNTVFVPPIPSDVALEGQKNIAGMDVPPTLFFVSPIQVDGKVIALLAQRHDIRKEYRDILSLTRPSETGETYAFDQDGRLLSDSRFEGQLAEIGIAKHDEQAIWSMFIKDPMQDLIRHPVHNYDQAGKPFTLMAQNAMNKTNGINITGYRGYRGVEVMGAWLWNDDINVGIALEIDFDDALSSYYLIKLMMIAIVSAQIFLLIVMIVILTRVNARAMEVLHLSKEELEGLIQERTESLEQTQNELLLANEELEEFAYRTSHDLRAPLLSSMKLLSMADSCLDKGDIQQTKSCLGHVNISLEKLESLVSDILSLTKTKNLREELQDIVVSEVVKNTLDQIKQMESFARLDIRINLAYDAPIRLKAHRFVLIVENLISNAVKYQDPDESAPFVEINSCQEGESFIFEVRDNGLGFPEDQHAQMFTMFKRFHPKTSYGSGLGMYMIKKSVDILGGQILFEAPEKGAIFKLVLPLNVDS
tara:strand:+ start:55769 stop:57607 length:1839 start_codon:yes stop_codon:yes gene_type:complete